MNVQVESDIRGKRPNQSLPFLYLKYLLLRFPHLRLTSERGKLMLFALIYVTVVINRGCCLSKNTQDEKSNPSPRQNHCPVTLEGRVYVISFLLTVITSLSCRSVNSVLLLAISCVRPLQCYPISVPTYVHQGTCYIMHTSFNCYYIRGRNKLVQI